MFRGFGLVTVARKGDEGSVFRGIGPFGWKRRFRWRDLMCVNEANAAFVPRRNAPSYRLISLTFERGRRLSLNFGTVLSAEQRDFLIALIRSQIAR